MARVRTERGCRCEKNLMEKKGKMAKVRETVADESCERESECGSWAEIDCRPRRRKARGSGFFVSARDNVSLRSIAVFRPLNKSRLFNISEFQSWPSKRIGESCRAARKSLPARRAMGGEPREKARGERQWRRRHSRWFGGRKGES